MSNTPVFQQVQATRPKANVFDLTHDVKMSGKMGNLMPIMAMECIPGDRVSLNAETLVRFMPTIAPVIHRYDVTCHYFFVPNRIVWPGWEDFIVGNPTGGRPYVTVNTVLTASEKAFLDYMGVPPCPPGATPIDINCIPMAAYQMIYNEYYRDQNLIPEVDFELSDGNNNVNRSVLCTLRRRAWEHDYFTSCLPFAQKGSPVDIPLGDVVLKANWDTSGIPTFEAPNGTFTNGNVEMDGTNSRIVVGGGVTPQAYDPNGTLQTEATTINDLRRAFMLQEWLERNARGGTRYIENIYAHFGVRSSDKRLQRPEYIVGVKSPVIISEVLNTTGETAGLPQGNMSGHGVSVASGNYGRYFCEEHGYIIGIMSIMPKTAYQQGMPRHYLKDSPFDYFWPTFANIGEQPVTEAEITAYTANPDRTFGYLPVYTDYRYIPSRVAGEMRSTLNYWHSGRVFDLATPPVLNQSFIECDPEDDAIVRIFANQDGTDYLVIHVLNKVKAVRLIPVFGTPML